MQVDFYHLSIPLDRVLPRIAERVVATGGRLVVVAESEADVRRLAGDEEHDVQTFERLVPELDMTELPAPLLAVQATRLEGAGVALGVTVHHAVADGRSLWRFVEAWAAACRGDTPPVPPPCFDRSRVRLHGGEELARTVLRDSAPNLPVVRSLEPFFANIFKNSIDSLTGPCTTHR